MEILELNDPEKVARLLERYIQSAHLNFLFGSGASMPAIHLAGNVEQEIDQHLAASEHEEANKKALTFIEELEYQHGFLPAGYTEGDDTDITLQNYTRFLRSIWRAPIGWSKLSVSA